MLLLKYASMDFGDTWTQCSSDGGHSRGAHKFGVKGHLGLIWGYFSNRNPFIFLVHIVSGLSLCVLRLLVCLRLNYLCVRCGWHTAASWEPSGLICRALQKQQIIIIIITLKTLLRLHNSIDFDETWLKRSLARGSFGVFRNFWSEVILGSLLKGQILNSLLQQNWLCRCVGLGQPSKSVHGDLFVRPMVKGSNVRKVQIWFYVRSNVELLKIRKLKLSMCWSWSTITKSSRWPLLLTYG